MRLPLFLVAQLCLLQLVAQTDPFIKDQGITSALHQANIGRILFTSSEIPLTQLAGKDGLATYELTNKSSLFITVFMDRSLTNNLHRLAPALGADSLTKIGGYQFSLFVDGALIYKSNITGSPYPRIKDTATTITKPLIDYENEGTWWSQFFWYRFLRNGGDSVLTEGHHSLKLEIRPYLKLATETKEGELIAAGELNLQVNRKPKIDASTIHLTPIRPYEGFDISTEKFDTSKIKELKGQIDAAIFRHITSIVVIKNGKLLIEEYFNGNARDSLNDPRSVGKSFASTMLGIAEKDGYLKSETQTLKEFYNLKSYSNYTPEKESIPLKDLLTMSSAFDGDDNDDSSPGNEENMYPTDDWVKFTLDLPVSATRPRDQWHYFTAGAMLLGDILNKSVPG